MIHCPPASITSTFRRSSSSMSGGSATPLLIRLPSMTIVSLREAGLPEPSISVPLRTTNVFLLVALMMRAPCCAGFSSRKVPPMGPDVNKRLTRTLRSAAMALGGAKTLTRLTFPAKHAANSIEEGCHGQVGFEACESERKRRRPGRRGWDPRPHPAHRRTAVRGARLHRRLGARARRRRAGQHRQHRLSLQEQGRPAIGSLPPPLRADDRG